jgi:hypothetical protein
MACYVYGIGRIKFLSVANNNFVNQRQKVIAMRQIRSPPLAEQYGRADRRVLLVVYIFYRGIESSFTITQMRRQLNNFLTFIA